jgi:glutamate synthase domain-containing protein 2
MELLGEGIVKNIIDEMLERMRELETTKSPNLVHGFSMLKIAAIAERAKHGVPVREMYGSTRKLPTFEELMFVPAMIDVLPVSPNTVNTEVVIGKNTSKPVKISTPIMLSAMAFGLSVNRRTKICWGKASAAADTACNSGDTGFYPEERKYARYYIVQLNRARYGNSEEEIEQADAVEIRFGQGAMGALSGTVDDADVDKELAKQLGVRPGKSSTRPMLHPEIDQGKTLKDIVQNVRNINPDIPVGVKVAAGNIEKDLDAVINAGCDFVTIDGGGGGTANSPEVTINNLGVPLVYAVGRAHRHLVSRGERGNIDLIVTGGLRDAGDCLKAMALGANAVYLGESALIAMSYSQWDRVPPGTAPSEMFLSFGDHEELLDIEEGTKALANFIKASTSEIAMLTGLVGKNDIKKVSIDDMIALTEHMSNATGARLAWQ